MAGLRDKFKKSIEKGNLGTIVEYIPMYSTGIDILDYMNGVKRADGSIGLGINAGKIVMGVGESGSGKTSMIIKIACSIADQFEDADIWHYDYERSTSKERVMQISGWDEEHYNEKYQIFQSDISAETLYRVCKEIEKIKLENRESIQFDSGRKDRNGKPIYELPPTILIIDSLALIAPEEIENDDDLKGQTGAMAIAKSNTNILKRIMSPITNANIIPLIVNHITEKIEIGPVHSKAQLNYMKQNQSIPGGKTAKYLTDTLIMLETGSKLDPDKELGVKGYYLDGILIKSRNTEAGTRFKMVFEQKVGINNLLTNFVNLKDFGRISGAGRSFKLDSCPDIKFAIKDFTETYNSNPTLKAEFDKAVKEEYSKLLAGVDSIKSNTPEYTFYANEDGVDIYTKDDKFYIIEDGAYEEVDYTE